MVKTIFILLVLASGGLAQSSSDRPSSLDHARDVGFSGPDQMRQAESVYSEAGALAGNVVSSKPPSLPTIRKEVQEVNLTFTVTDHHDHFVRNLAASDFTILDNGEAPRRITYFESQSELPLRVAIVIDSSDSVTYAFDLEKQSAAAFLKRIMRQTSDLALVVGFNQEVRLAQELANDRHILFQAIKTLRSGGETAIYDAVSAASQELAKLRETQTARRAIILITDGEDNRSHVTLKQMEEIVQRNECAVYVMSISLERGRNSDQQMKELSEVTGGNFFHARAEDLTSAFSKIDKELRSQYVVSYRPASVSPDGSFHQLVVLGPQKLRIRHRDGYFAK
jgi:VWFA-related protein